MPFTAFLLATLVAAMGVTASPSATTPSVTLREIPEFGPNPGNLRMLIYTPPNLADGAPVVVVARGCLQTVQEMADQSGWPAIADRYGFALIFPDTSKVNEPFANCFRTWFPEHQVRGAGEPLSVYAMIEWTVKTLGADPERVFISGLSSGAMLGSVMLATYPDVFAAGALASGTPYKCANHFEDVAPCARGDVTHTGEEWGDLVRGADPDFSGPRPRVSIWHGESDTIISPRNAQYEVLQWINVLGAQRSASLSKEIQGVSHNVFVGSDGRPSVEFFSVGGMGHAMAVRPGNGAEDCGEPGQFTQATSICSALWIARWFGIAN